MISFQIYISLDGDGRDPDPVDPGDGSPECGPSSWHGTCVASILAASHDASVSFRLKGIAQNSTVLPERVLGECRAGYASDVADAVVWAAEQCFCEFYFHAKFSNRIITFRGLIPGSPLTRRSARTSR